MADLEAVETRLSFDDILEAVQDSKRGRWFLQEFETRIQKRDTNTILNAVSRLEQRMESLAPHAANPDDLGKVRSAIAAARNDLMKLDIDKNVLSVEGRLFSNLAEMARKAMPVAVDSNAGIVRALQLVDEIDRAIAPEVAEDRGAKYFTADASLFERLPTPPKPVLVQAPQAIVETKPSRKDETAPTGAKLVIRKTSQFAEPGAPLELPVATTPQFEPNTPDMPAIDNPRIVIVRRKAEDMPEVLEPDAEASAA